jgi:hypothetical protein
VNDPGVEPTSGRRGAWPPAELRPAVVLITVETVAEAVAVAWRDDFRAALRVALVACIALKFLFVWLLGRRSAGALFGLVLWEVTALLVAVAATGWPAGVRLGLAATAVMALVLLVRVARAFPEATVPSLRSE